jgi:hypothetical protein
LQYNKFILLFFKIMKKLAGQGKGTVGWRFKQAHLRGFDSHANAYRKSRTRADVRVPSCCRIAEASTMDELFGEWIEQGMVDRHNIRHWIHHFNAALQTLFLVVCFRL